MRCRIRKQSGRCVRWNEARRRSLKRFTYTAQCGIGSRISAGFPEHGSRGFRLPAAVIPQPMPSGVLSLHCAGVMQSWCWFIQLLRWNKETALFRRKQGCFFGLSRETACRVLPWQIVGTDIIRPQGFVVHSRGEQCSPVQVRRDKLSVCGIPRLFRYYLQNVHEICRFYWYTICHKNDSK